MRRLLILFSAMNPQLDAFGIISRGIHPAGSSKTHAKFGLVTTHPLPGRPTQALV